MASHPEPAAQGLRWGRALIAAILGEVVLILIAIPVYGWMEPNKTLTYDLYNFQLDGEGLLPEFRHLDFFWLLKGDEVSEELMNDLMESIRSISGVQLVTELTRIKIKHREHLIF